MLLQPQKHSLSSSSLFDYDQVYADSIKNPEKFWSTQAEKLLWMRKWDKTLLFEHHFAKWFVNGKTNIVINTLDRHATGQKSNHPAIIWEGQDGLVRTFTYLTLHQEVNKLANGLKSLGVKKGDTVCIYLPRIPEQIIAMLACAKIGAIHTVVFSGFSIEALKNRVISSQAKTIICTSVYPYKDKLVHSLQNVVEAIKNESFVSHVIVIKRLKDDTTDIDLPIAAKIHWFDKVVEAQSASCATEVMDSNDPLFILYTSGSTGKPKGVVHGHGGYMVGAYTTSKWVFNLEADDVYFCTADPGWITGHTYIAYGPLINGVTTLIYEGTPDYPDAEVWWRLIEKYKVTKFYTAPTAIRALMRLGDELPTKHNLSSLKILGTVGEPINPKAWLWYYKVIGGEKCPIMDTWWQTETGMHILTPLPSVALKPGSAFKPFPGVEMDVVDEKGQSVAPETQGYLIIKKPWPSMLLGLYNDPDKYQETYWSKIPDVYFTGDSAKKDKDGYYWIIGRNDDVIKVSGHRLGSAEIESAFVSHPAVAEAAAIGIPHEIKGESIKVFVILKKDASPSEALKAELVTLIRKQIGPIATPDTIEFRSKLPKTRSGKIMRRVLKAQELGQPVGDISTLDD